MKIHGRKKPYTPIGIRRLPCVRCGAPAEVTWQVCSDGGLFRPICAKCDIDLNCLVMEWFALPGHEKKIATYIKKMTGDAALTNP